MDSALTGSVILVTGASGGIGGAAARILAGEGVRVIAHAHRQSAAAEALASEVGGFAAIADLRREAEVDRLFERSVETQGRVDGIVVNAGIWPEEHVPVCDLELARWQNTIETDLTSAFLTCRAFLRHLRDVPRDAASIVLVASTAAIFGEAGHADYAAAKAAMAYGLTRSLKNEIVRLAPRGRVNCVCPGWTRTPMAEPAMRDPALLERVFATTPLRKVAEPEDVAHLITYLLSDRLAGHVTGAIVPVAGGMEGRRLDIP